jgi:cell division protein FtsI (penicillin-binding protein 3)
MPQARRPRSGLLRRRGGSAARPRRGNAPREADPRKVARRDAALAKVRGASLLRLRVGFLIIAMVVSVFAVRLFQLQGLDARAYAERARAVGAVSQVLPATRGAITDRNGVPLAESLDGMMIVADPTKTKDDAAAIASILQKRLGVDYIATVRNLTWPDTHFRYIARRVPSTKATRVVQHLDDLGYKGLATERDPVRSYPGKDVAANLVGRLNAEGDAADGAELLYDGILSGKDGFETYDVGDGHRIPLGDNSTTEPVDGQDVALTIDRDVQWYTQRVLRQTVEDAGGTSGSAVVMDTHTGELLAEADYPTYDPNVTTNIDEKRLGSRSLREVYEPGSVQKVLTLASVIDAGKADPRTELTVPGEYISSGKAIKDFFVHGLIKLTVAGVLAKSSNIGTLKIAQHLSNAERYRYLRKFGLGSRTGLQGYAEQPGMLSPPSTWIPITRDNIAFGQGLAVNAVQMATAINAIANGGEYVSPSLLKGKADTQFGEVGSDLATRHRVVSRATAAKVARMMEMVLTPDAGTAPVAQIPGYRVAGKTGTAQVAENGHYSTTKFTVSFAGFAPADDPRFTVYVVVHNPRDGMGGGATAGPAFRKIMTYLLQKYAVPPTGTKPAHIPVTWGRNPMGTAE